MKKYFIAVGIVAFCAILFSFVNQPEKKKTEYKWFKYRAGDTDVPPPSAFHAKQASNYVLVGDEPYCRGVAGYCGIYAPSSDATGEVLPVIGISEESEINAFFNNPAGYNGMSIDRRLE